MIFNVPTSIYFGIESISDFVSLFDNKDIAVVVSESGARLKNRIVADVIKQMETHASSVTIIKGANNYSQDVDSIRNKISKLSYRPQALVAIGGASVVDCVKVASLIDLQREQQIWDFICTGDYNGVYLPFYIVNTTMGTGSEINNCAVISRGSEKRGVVHPFLFPKATLVLPQLSKTISNETLQFQSLDCLFHALEALLSVNANIFSKECSLSCIRKILHCLVRLADNDSDELREELAWASIYSGFADMFGGCLSIHAIGHAINSICSTISHGESIGIIAPAYYRKMIELNTKEGMVIPEASIALEVFRGYLGSDIKDIPDALCRLIDVIQIPMHSLKDIGITESDFIDILENARLTTGVLFNNDPVKFKDEDLFIVLQQSM